MKVSILSLILLTLAVTGEAQKPDYQVYALRFASVLHPFPLSLLVDKGPDKDSVNMVFMYWLIRGDNGRNILLDAGFLRVLDDQKDFEPLKYMRPDSALLPLHIPPAAITDIIVSHPHWDHIDGLSLFPNAHIWMQKEDYNYFVGAAWQKGGNSGGFTKRDVHMLVDMNIAGRLTLVDGDDKEIIPGITVYTGSRHTFNSQFVVVQTAGNRILLASDNLWVYYSLQHMLPPSAGGTFDPDAFVRSMQRMKTLVSDPRYIIPGHDGRVFSLFPTVAEGIVKIE